MVGEVGFGPTISCSRNRRVTRLRYSPMKLESCAERNRTFGLPILALAGFWLFYQLNYAHTNLVATPGFDPGFSAFQTDTFTRLVWRPYSKLLVSLPPRCGTLDAIALHRYSHSTSWWIARESNSAESFRLKSCLQNRRPPLQPRDPCVRACALVRTVRTSLKPEQKLGAGFPPTRHPHRSTSERLDFGSPGGTLTPNHSVNSGAL
jgi:hypothetical protein